MPPRRVRPWIAATAQSRRSGFHPEQDDRRGNATTEPSGRIRRQRLPLLSASQRTEQVVYPGAHPLCRTLALSTTRNHATRVAMVARLHLRCTLHPQTPRLPPPEPPPCNQTTPRPHKVPGFGPTGSPRPMEPQQTLRPEHRRTCANTSATEATHMGEGADASGPAHPCASDR